MPGVVDEIRKAIIEGDDEAASARTDAALVAGLSPLEILRQGIVAGIEETGRLWKDNVYFLPDVVLSAQAFKAAMSVVEPRLAKMEKETAGRIVLGVVAGDMHDLGKSIVTAMLTGAGFHVIDLGVDVPTGTFVERVKELKPDILGVGCYMSTTMLEVREIMNELTTSGLRRDVKIMVGGVPTSQKFADEVGADAWGRDALDAVDKARDLMKGRR